MKVVEKWLIKFFCRDLSFTKSIYIDNMVKKIND